MIGDTITESGLSERIAALQRMRNEATDAQQTVIRPLGVAYRDALITATPRGRGEERGKRLYESYDTDETSSGNRVTYTITNKAPQLTYVLRGRGPVVAKRARALRFVIDGRVFFRRRVGPAAANNFPPKARAAMQGEINAAPAQMARAIIQRYGA